MTGCDELMSHLIAPDDLDIISKHKAEQQDVIRVHKLVFAPDHKTFAVTTRMYGDIGPYSLTDSNSVRISIHSPQSKAAPRLVGMRNVKMENFTKKDIQVLTVVDLTQPQEVLNRIRDYIIELRAVLNDSNLHVSFIYGDSISKTRYATDYILQKYMVQEQAPFSMLYRAISTNYDVMLSHQGCWTNARRMAMLVFADSDIYDDKTDMPIDPDHYEYEEDLARKSDNPNPNLLVCFADMSRHSDNTHTKAQDLLVVKHLCERTRGIFMTTYNGTEFKNTLLRVFHISEDANEFVFENPDGKVYIGNFETLTVHFNSVKNDSLVARFSTVINEGSFYKPIFVNGRPTVAIILLGALLSALIIFSIWLLLQFVVPYISYQLFRRKYVIRYAGRNMGIGKTLVAEACYLCKEPFQTGDEVVVKCQHTMHKSCWDENGYHCTEYSDRCKHGSHYYNSHDLTDRRNAPFYMKWIIIATMATTLAWMMFISRSHHVTAFFVRRLVSWAVGVEPGSAEALALLPDNAISPLASFGFTVGLSLTVAIAILSVRLANVSRNILNILARGVVAGIICFVAFVLTNVLIIVTELTAYAFLLEWIPWVLTAFVIAWCGTYGTKVRLRKILILPSVFISLLSMYLWWLFYNNTIDYRLGLLLGFIFFGIGLAACIATVAPRSERYFLHVGGAIKEMDIALFKWFRNAPDRVVTIGKSLDCSLQLSWDISGNVAPIHAEIRLHRHVPYLTALEEGVIVNGRSAQVGKRIWLYHGTSFAIGNTTFQYIEKDI